MFEVGDAVVHPIRGAGIVIGVEERQWHGNSALYYKIQLLNQPESSVMIPTGAAKELGLRRVISQEKLKEVWRVLSAGPKSLPDDHKKRYKLLRERLKAGDVFQIAETIRDMAWRQQRKGRLNTVGKRLYEKSIKILAGEIAALQDIDLSDADVQVRTKLQEGLPSASAM